MTDKQKIYTCLEELPNESIARITEQLEEFEIVEKPVQCFYLDSITILPEDDTLIPEKPLWVLQQENKKLWRK